VSGLHVGVTHLPETQEPSAVQAVVHEPQWS